MMFLEPSSSFSSSDGISPSSWNGKKILIKIFRITLLLKGFWFLLNKLFVQLYKNTNIWTNYDESNQNIFEDLNKSDSNPNTLNE